jgi:hypothetical protein
MITPLDAALTYAARGWHVFPTTRAKKPLTQNGFKDATSDLAIITAMWQCRPDAVPAAATGAISGIVVLDIDCKNGVNGWDSLDAIGISTCPHTPGQHTPSGGYQAFFEAPGFEVPCSAGKLGLGLDVRGDGGYVCLPGGPDGRSWDPHLNLDTVPLAPMPGWISPHAIEPQKAQERPGKKLRLVLNPYTDKALDNAVGEITSAPDGAQQETLNRACFGIGQLAGSGAIAPAAALKVLHWAASRMPSYDARNPWQPDEVRRVVERSFDQGLRVPREIPHGR